LDSEEFIFGYLEGDTPSNSPPRKEKELDMKNNVEYYAAHMAARTKPTGKHY
jgi:hypothetical protein